MPSTARRTAPSPGRASRDPATEEPGAVKLRALLLLLPALVLVLAGCGADPAPEVTFGAGGQTVTARPTQYCNVAFTECRNDADAPVTLRVPAGAPVRVTVPPEIAQAPWLIVFTYVAADGTRSDGRTGLFTRNVGDYTLTLPAGTDRLLTAQVQQLGAPPAANDANGVDFPARATWVLTTTL